MPLSWLSVAIKKAMIIGFVNFFWKRRSFFMPASLRKDSLMAAISPSTSLSPVFTKIAAALSSMP